MTQSEFFSKIFNKFKKKELALINTNIYYHPDHVKYYEWAKCGEYELCYEYLIENRGLLGDIKYAPSHLRSAAKKSLKNAKSMT